MMSINRKIIEKHGLNEDEYKNIQKLLKRSDTYYSTRSIV